MGSDFCTSGEDYQSASQVSGMGKNSTNLISLLFVGVDYCVCVGFQ